MNLRIYLRKLQLKDFTGKNDVVYQAVNPSAPFNPSDIKAVPGSIPNNNWQDFTDSIANYEKLVLSWSIQHNSNGDVVNGSLQVQKGVSNTLQFERAAYEYLKSWLIKDIGCKLNAVEVKIVDEDCGYFEGYVVTPSQLNWCDIEGLCVYEVTLRQRDPLLQCVRSTPISDNWRGWFPTPDQPNSTKKHPRFSYCVEMRPNAILVIGWFNLGALGGITYILALLLTPIVNSIIFIANLIKFIGDVFGGNNKPLEYFNPNSLLDYFKILFVESAGCGREHPAPLISDYIRNVCDKCGIKYDETTIPIFFADTLTMVTSSSNGQKVTFKNPYKYACYLDAPMKRGIRRFNDLHLFSQSQPNQSYWVYQNAPLDTLDMLLNKVKDVYNSEWRIVDGTLYFNRKDQFLNEAPIYDFSEKGADRHKLINLCFEPFTAQMGAYCRGLYTIDSVDTSGNEGNQANGLVSFGDVSLNPNFSSSTPMDKTTQFSAARFRLDGNTTDYIMDAMQVIANGQILQIWLARQLADVATEISKYCDYALLLAAETTFSPKILLWDGVSYENARAIGSAGAVDNYRAPNALQMVAIKTNTNLSTSDQVPEINLEYPLEYNFSTGNKVYKQFRDIHPPNTFVQGSTFISNRSHEAGLYQVDDNWGSILFPNKYITRAVARLVNYPMYFAPQFKGGLWDRFHFIDDPRRKPQMNYNWTATIPACCEDIKRLQLNGDGMGVQLNTKVLLPTPFPGRTTGITLSLDSSNEIGKFIELKGEC